MMGIIRTVVATKHLHAGSATTKQVVGEALALLSAPQMTDVNPNR